ncbi:MAG TPA: SusC/RagA family TonB-linked outer membrane protein, partial [Chitinophagaceae bacterium]
GSSGDFGILKKGGSYNDIYGRAFLRDDAGHIVINSATGIPFFVDEKFLGNPNPKFIAGWKNVFSWSGFSLQCLVDGKFGGKVLSITEAYLDQLGVSQRTANTRDQGQNIFIANAVDENGNEWKGSTNAKEYYKKISGKTPVGEAYLYNATSIRLRELCFTYQFALNDKMIKNLKLGITANNLFFFYRKAPFDPEQVPGVNPGGVGVDVFGLPNYRSIGFILNASF